MYLSHLYHLRYHVTCTIIGSLQKAIAHFETFHQLSARNKWHTTSGEGLHGIACEHLRRVYTSMAEEVHVHVHDV